MPKHAHFQFHQLKFCNILTFDVWDVWCEVPCQASSPKLCFCIHNRNSLGSNNKDFTFTTEVESNLWAAIDVKMQEPESVYKIPISAGDGLTLEWPRRVLHLTCLAAKHMHTLADVYKPTTAQPRTHMQKDKKAGTQWLQKHKNMHPPVLRHMWETDDCRYTRMCTQTHVYTPAEQRTLLDYLNSVSFDWFRAFWNITATCIWCSLSVWGLCTIFNIKLNSNGLHGSYLADGVYPDAVYLDYTGLLQVLLAKDWFSL